MTSAAPGWTVIEAQAEFAKTGVPVDGLAQIIRALPGLQPVAETRSGAKGGRGQHLYDIAQLQRLHAAISPWLARQ